MAAEASAGEEEIIQFLQDHTLVGLLPVPPPNPMPEVSAFESHRAMVYNLPLGYERWTYAQPPTYRERAIIAVQSSAQCS